MSSELLSTPQQGGGAPVEFVINCFERNIKQVTSPGFLAQAVHQQSHDFSLRTLLINNVANRPAAEALAQGAVDRGEIDRYLFVADHLDEALAVTHLKREDFGRYLHWSDCCIVALVLDGPDWLCYADVDMQLSGRGDWVDDSLTVMASDPRVLVANPNWRMTSGEMTVQSEADESGLGWFKGYGFTDQVFLVRRSRLSVPLMARVVPLVIQSPASARWPAYQVLFGRNSLFFEQIVDAYMRRKRLLRVTITSREFEPIPMTSYPTKGLHERLASGLSRRLLKGLAALRRRFPNAMTDPRWRTTGLLDPEFTGPTDPAQSVDRKS